MARGIHAFQPVPTRARVTVAIPPNKITYVPVEFTVGRERSVVFFEPDPSYIARYQAYPCPGILDAAQPTVIRLLNASADQILQVMPGMVFGRANLVRRVANRYYLELVPPWASGEDTSLVFGSPCVPDASLEGERGRVLTLNLESGSPCVPTPKLCGQNLPSIVVTQVEPPGDEEVLESYRRYLIEEPDSFAEQCVYLTDSEIREHLHWDNLDAPDDWKQKLFELCCAYRGIFASQGNMGKLQTVQHSIDAGLADPIKSRPYRMTHGEIVWRNGTLSMRRSRKC